MREYFLEEQGIYYRANECVEGRPTVLFIHGVSGSSSAWSAYEEKFKHIYNVISYDLRGHGKSKRFNNYEDYSLKHFVEDICVITTHFKLEKFFIVSHSFGTLFALDFVLEHQDIVQGVVFLSPNFTIGKKWLKYLMAPVTWGIHRFGSNNSNNQGRHIDYSKYKDSGDWNIPRMIDDIGNTGLKTYLYCTKQVCDFDRAMYLKGITIPVLVIHGGKDTIFPAKNSKELLKKIKNIEIIILEKSDHILVLNNFDEVSNAIESFVTKVYTV